MALTPQQRRRMRFNQLLMMQMSMAAYASTKASWTPLELFTNDIVGAWYDPSDFSTMFQDAAGTTPVTAVEQPVGLHLDKSKGLALGAELVSNGDFSSATGWTNGAGHTITGGKLNISTAGYTETYQAIASTAARWYKVSFDVDSTNNNVSITIAGGPAVTVNGTGSKTIYVLAGSSTARLTIISGTVTCVIDNISCKEIAGNHRYQSTSAARPTLSARYNLLTKTEEHGTSPWGIADSGTGFITSNVNNQAISPRGDTTASALLEVNGGTGAKQISHAATLVATSYTYTKWVSVEGRTWCRLMLFDGASFHTCYYNVASGTVGTASAGVTGTIVETISVGGRSYSKLKLVVTTAAGSGFAYFQGATADSGADTYSGETGKGYYVWGSDLRPTNDGVGLPAYQRVNTSTDYDTSGFPMYLRYDGTDDFMQTASVDFSGTDALSIFLGSRKLSDAVAYGILVETGSVWSDVNGGFILCAPGAVAGQHYAGLRGSASAIMLPVADTAPDTNVFALLGKISTDYAELRVNGVSVESSASDQGSGNFSNRILYFGARAGTSLFFNGREYQTIIRGAASNNNEIASAEAFVNSRTKAF